MDNETLLIRFFSGELKEPERAELERLLQEDAAFRAQFEFEKELQQTLVKGKGSELKAKLQGFEKEIAAKEKALSADISQVPRKKPGLWGIAASIAALIALGWWGMNTFSGPNMEALYQDNYESYPNTAVTITRGDVRETLERDAFTAYESGDFGSALEKLSALDDRDYTLFYRAQCQLQLGRTTDAIESLQKNIETGTVYLPESQWYLALAYLKNGQKELALKELRILIDRYDYKKEDATALLTTLE